MRLKNKLYNIDIRTTDILALIFHYVHCSSKRD